MHATEDFHKKFSAYLMQTRRKLAKKFQEDSRISCKGLTWFEKFPHEATNAISITTT